MKTNKIGWTLGFVLAILIGGYIVLCFFGTISLQDTIVQFSIACMSLISTSIIGLMAYKVNYMSVMKDRNISTALLYVTDEYDASQRSVLLDMAMSLVNDNIKDIYQFWDSGNVPSAAPLVAGSQMRMIREYLAKNHITKNTLYVLPESIVATRNNNGKDKILDIALVSADYDGSPQIFIKHNSNSFVIVNLGVTIVRIKLEYFRIIYKQVPAVTFSSHDISPLDVVLLTDSKLTIKMSEIFSTTSFLLCDGRISSGGYEDRYLCNYQLAEGKISFENVYGDVIIYSFTSTLSEGVIIPTTTFRPDEQSTQRINIKHIFHHESKS